MVQDLSAIYLMLLFLVVGMVLSGLIAMLTPKRKYKREPRRYLKRGYDHYLTSRQLDTLSNQQNLKYTRDLFKNDR